MNETELMLTTIRQCRRIDLYLDGRPLSLLERSRLENMQVRRDNGEPLQYILGECAFFGLRFKVDPRVLIPRPETELLVDEIVRLAKEFSGKPVNILDIGTGSGNIAISLAKFISQASVMAIDVSASALALAGENAKANGVENQIQFLNEDLHQFMVHDGQKFNIIVSNPPYVEQAQLATLPRDVQQEPLMALDGGEDGLKFYSPIIAGGSRMLADGGYLFLEIGDGQRPGIEQIFSQSAAYENISFKPDYVGTNRIVVAQKIKF